MAHSHLNKRKAFEFIALTIERGEQPTDQQIMDLCGFWDVELARTLLADLADEGAIRMSFAGGARTIALGPKEQAKAAPVARPIPSIVSPREKRRQAVDADAVTERIVAIVRGGSPSKYQEYPAASGTVRKASSVGESTPAKRIEDRAASPMPERPEVETVEAQREGTPTRSPSPASVDQGPRPACPPAQAAEGAAKRDAEPLQAVEARCSRRAFMASPESRTKRMAIYLTPADYETIDAEAERIEAPTGRLASDAIADFAEALRCDTEAKHRLSAAVQRAWREDGRPLDVFVTALIDLGLEEYLRFRRGKAAA